MPSASIAHTTAKHAVDWTRTASKCTKTKEKKTRAKCAKLTGFLALNMQICDFFVNIVVVVT